MTTSLRRKTLSYHRTILIARLTINASTAAPVAPVRIAVNTPFLISDPFILIRTAEATYSVTVLGTQNLRRTAVALDHTLGNDLSTRPHFTLVRVAKQC